MASTPSMATANLAETTNGDQSSYRFALYSLTTLFFMWGFITCLNDILIPYLKNLFSLSYTEAMLIQFCFFGAYFLVSIPASLIISKIGFQRGIVVGLVTASIGCAMFYPAAEVLSYPLFLGALFVLASGITLLQVSANPFVSILGSSETASSRLTMTQAFNSLGTTVAPFFGAFLILGVAGDSAGSGVQGPYLLLAATLLVMAFVFSRLTLPNPLMEQSQTTSVESSETVWSHKHLVLGAIGIFLYVGAEVSIGSFLVNFLGEEHIAGMEESKAAQYIAYYWGGAMVGRFIGAAVMQKISAGKVLAFNGAMVIALLVLTMMSSGAIAMWSVLLVGLFNSIMFPTIFSLAIQKLGGLTSKGSGLLCLAIVGGAIIPVFQGMLADSIGIQLSFALPLVCYLFIAYYGLAGSKPASFSVK